MTNRLLSSSLLVLLAVLPAYAYAHGDGASFEKQSGEYLIDIGYDPAPPVAGEATLFDFSLLRIADGSEVPYSHVWVRILDERKTVLASGVHAQEVGATTLLFVFPEDKTYTLESSFRTERGEIASASFSVPVSPKSDTPITEAPWFLPLLFFLGVCSGVLGIALWKRPLLVGKSQGSQS